MAITRGLIMYRLRCARLLYKRANHRFERYLHRHPNLQTTVSVLFLGFAVYAGELAVRFRGLALHPLPLDRVMLPADQVAASLFLNIVPWALWISALASLYVAGWNAYNLLTKTKAQMALVRFVLWVMVFAASTGGVSLYASARFLDRVARIDLPSQAEAAKISQAIGCLGGHEDALFLAALSGDSFAPSSSLSPPVRVLLSDAQGIKGRDRQALAVQLRAALIGRTSPGARVMRKPCGTRTNGV